MQASGRILQIGSQQRSTIQFRYAAELVRNGRIGDLQRVEIGLPGDPAGGDKTPMPVPEWFNYEMWLGETPYVYYTVDRVHPQTGYDRPGWLRCRQFGAGMITGWGAHHIDSAHWGMNTEYTGPVEIWGHAEFPDHGLWDVHGPFKTEANYANGVHMSISGDYPNGIKFYGTKGWIFVSRGNEKVTQSRPRPQSSTTTPPSPPATRRSSSPSSDRDEIHLYESTDQHGNWLDCIVSRKEPISPVETGPSRLLHLPPARHGHGAQTQALLGSGERAVPQRRRSQQHARPPAARSLPFRLRGDFDVD